MPSPVRRLAALTGLLAFSASLGAQALPAPTGLHRVGRASFYWTDPQRTEAAADVPGGKRRIAVHAWYPGAPEGGFPAPYLPGAGRLLASTAAGPLSTLFGASWPAIIANQVRTHSYERLPVKEGARLPVLVFSPGAGVPVAAYSTQLEELASHGYVVMGVEHSYEAPGVVFPDGRVIGTARAYWEQVRTESGSEEEFENRVAAFRAADLRFVVDRLGEVDRDGASIFHRRLDLGRIGVFGHARGGRAALAACQLDRRFRACGSQGERWEGRGVAQPLLVMDLTGTGLAEAGATERKGSGGGYQITIRAAGVTSQSYADLRLLGRTATLDGYVLPAVTRFTRAFFDRHVRGFRGTMRELAGGAGENVEIRRFGGSRE